MTKIIIDKGITSVMSNVSKKFSLHSADGRIFIYPSVNNANLIFLR